MGSSRTTAARNRASNETYWLLVLVVIVAVVQGTLIARVRLLGASPNLLLVVAVCWSLLRSVPDGLLLSFTGGVCIDLVAGAPLGGSSLALMPACFVAGVGRRRVFANSILLRGLLVTLATPIYAWLMLLLQQVRGQEVQWLNATTHIVAPEMLLNGLLMLPVFPILRWVSSQLGGATVE